jgi:transposase
MDTSKHIFQLHGVTAAEEPALRKKLRRKEMVRFFEKLAPTVIAIEACGASHHWARLLQSFGHSVKLIAPQLVKAVRQARQERYGGRGSALRGDEPADDALRAGEDG